MQSNTFTKELNKLRQNHVLLAILVLLLVCAVAWTTLGLFASQQKTRITPKLLKQSQPLTPTLDVETLSKLDSKRWYSDAELVDFPIYIITTSLDSREEIVTTVQELERLGRQLAIPAPTPAQDTTPASDSAAESSEESVGTPLEDDNSGEPSDQTEPVIPPPLPTI
jgi:hypothetical protein